MPPQRAGWCCQMLALAASASGRRVAGPKLPLAAQARGASRAATVPAVLGPRKARSACRGRNREAPVASSSVSGSAGGWVVLAAVGPRAPPPVASSAAATSSSPESLSACSAEEDAL
eukprot:CAMPEP_0206165952 /NCGR_PEP_ID=MMETSP1474-20131121/22215_1 /ASSEMBLY_ACC=CAM_ASM_001110 /TAXON_ID=97495 /ORGANISM="Imantonia sp., Strain RCC918" /LENGTH=116 /DNA_ID=CAMNT_0053569641 /DNA_START=77 /DNA_END=427 /DNA_ORIENTATION=+